MWKKSEEQISSYVTEAILDHPALAKPPAGPSLHGLRLSMMDSVVVMLKVNVGSIVRVAGILFREIII